MYALLEREGGMLRMVFNMARRMGAARTREPMPGDPAVVRIQRGHHGAIMTPSGKWMVKLRAGLHITCAAKPVMAWSI